MNRAQHIGHLAEQQIKMWASVSRIVATKPDEDRLGWDLMLELPFGPGQAGVKCLTQVKATDRTCGRCDVRLDTWTRLVRAPMPSFFLVLEYSGREEPRRFYVVHVWKEWIARVLERLRQEESRGSSNLSRLKLALRWRPSDEVTSLSGAGLLDALQRATGHDPYKYISEKSDLLATVGFEKVRARGTFNISGISASDIGRRLADHAVGLTPYLEATSVTLAEERFGISIPCDLGPVQYPMKMRIQPAPIDVSVRFQNGDASRLVHEPAKMYAAIAAFPFLPREYQKIRITSEFVTLTLDPGTHSMHVEVRLPPQDCRTTIGAAFRAATILRMVLEKPQKEMCIDILTPAGPIVFSREHLGAVSGDPGAMPHIEDIESCYHLLGEYGLPDSAQLVVGDIYDLASEVRSLLYFHHASPGSATFAGTMIGAPEPEQAMAAVVFVKGLTLGDIVLAGVFVLRGNATFLRRPEAEDEWSCEITGGQIESCERIVLPAGHDPLPRLQRSVEAVRDRLVQEGVPTVIHFRAK